jgi:hypothetical protein
MLRVHVIMMALNEEIFLRNQLRILYPFCSGISILTQYDRDWYGKPVTPDRGLLDVARFPDPEGKIHLVLRRWRDQAAALNCEMSALASNSHAGVCSHGTDMAEIQRFHDPPDYFWIVDSDEFYDAASVPRVLEYLETRRPRGMRMIGYNYIGSWNRRVPLEVVRFCQFGFLRPGVRFESIRHTNFNESRLSKLLSLLHVPDFSARLFGFIECPPAVGVFHHGCWLGDRARLTAKFSRSAHQWAQTSAHVDSLKDFPFETIPTLDLPQSIRDADWPEGYLDRAA